VRGRQPEEALRRLHARHDALQERIDAAVAAQRAEAAATARRYAS
jgi:hypothetical protein